MASKLIYPTVGSYDLPRTSCWSNRTSSPLQEYEFGVWPTDLDSLVPCYLTAAICYPTG